MTFVFAALLAAGAAYFLLHRRTFDLFAVAFGGGAFYFFPLIVGHVPDWNSKDPLSTAVPLSAGTYAVGFLVTSTIIAGAALFDAITTHSKISRAPRLSMANWYLGISIVGLIGATMSGNILDLNKTYALTQVGYWFVLFETAAATAWIDAHLYRKWTQLTLATLLLIADIAIGFRLMVVMCFLAFIVVEIGVKGKIELWRSLPFLGTTVAVMFIAMLTINNIRELTLPHLGVKYTELDQTESSSPPQPHRNPIQFKSTSQALSEIASRIPLLMWQMEPFVTQAILSETMRHNFRCPAPQVRNLALLVPFAGRLVGEPTTFERQFKPVLFPHYWSGMAGNAWAETFCDFGYTGIVVEILLIVLLISTIQLSITRLNSSAVPALLLSGVFLAFYIHRNDKLFELLLIRRALMIFAMAWLLRLGLAWTMTLVRPKAIAPH